MYSFVGTGVVAGPEFARVLTEAAKVPCLMNSADLEASTEIVLRLGVARSQMPKQKAAARPTAARPQAAGEGQEAPLPSTSAGPGVLVVMQWAQGR